MIDMMLETDPKILEQTNRNSGFENTNQAISRQAVVCMNPIIKAGEAQRSPVIQIKRFFQLGLQATPKIIMPEFRLDGAKDEYFVKHDGTGTKSTGSFILAAVYSF